MCELLSEASGCIKVCWGIKWHSLKCQPCLLGPVWSQKCPAHLSILRVCVCVFVPLLPLVCWRILCDRMWMFLSEQMKWKERRDTVWVMITVMAEFYRCEPWHWTLKMGLSPDWELSCKPSIVNGSNLLLQSPGLHMVFLQICSHFTHIPLHTHTHTLIWTFCQESQVGMHRNQFFFPSSDGVQVTYLILISQQCDRALFKFHWFKTWPWKCTPACSCT